MTSQKVVCRESKRDGQLGRKESFLSFFPSSFNGKKGKRTALSQVSHADVICELSNFFADKRVKNE